MSNNNGCLISGFSGTQVTLTIVFLVLKLTHVIDWSWVWILSPIWLGWALGLAGVGVFLFGFFGFAFLAFLYSSFADRRR